MLIVGLNYGCEVDPTLAYLRAKFPEYRFFSEHEPAGTFGSNWSIRVDGYHCAQLARLRDVAVAFRDGYSRGYDAGFHDPVR